MKYLVLVLFVIGCGKQDNSARNPNRFSDSPSFLIAGQSNSVSPAQNIAPYESSTGFITVNDYYGNNDLFTPTHTRPIDSSISWMYMAEAMNRPVFINNVGRGNTSALDWAKYLHPRIETALQQRHYDAILWVQGESDIGLHTTEQDYYNNMKLVIGYSKDVQPGIEWYIALDSAGHQADNNPVRNAQRRLINEGFALQGPDLDTIRTNPSWVELTFGEFVGDGLKEHGRLWYETLKNRF